MVEEESLGLYTGCLIRTRLPHLEKSVRAVFERFGLRLHEPEGVSCCPDPVGMRGADQDTWLAVAARNLAILGANVQPTIVLCSGCYSTFREAEHMLATTPPLRAKVEAALKRIGRSYSSPARVEHFARFVYEGIGPQRLASAMTRSWKGLPVAVHHGCHMVRPSHILAFDDAENPVKLDRLIQALGGEVVDFPRKMLCCGFTVQGVDDDLSLQMGYEKLKIMKDHGARAVVVMCPSCMLQFDVKQRLIEERFGARFQLPVLFLTEYIGLALGLSPRSMGLHFHRVDVLTLAREIFPEEDGGGQLVRRFDAAPPTRALG
jgi:heterodisulfide reductase subunit B